MVATPRADNERHALPFLQKQTLARGANPAVLAAKIAASFRALVRRAHEEDRDGFPG
jgi:hypothetical protein